MDHVFIAEDETSLRENLAWACDREGFVVHAFDNGQDCYEAYKALYHGAQAEASQRRVLLLDVGLPKMDGIELCTRIRSFDRLSPLVFITSRDSEVDRVHGLESGADDYLCKPFSLRELFVRVQILLRRVYGGGTMVATPNRLIQSGRLIMDLDGANASFGGQELRLTITEFRILEHLASHSGMVKTREQLQAAAYEEPTFVADRTMDTHIKRLRKKLSQVGADDLIQTVHGFGYKWTAP